MASPPENAAYLRPLIAGRKRWKYDALCLLWLVTALWFWAWWLSPEVRIDAPRYWVLTLALGWLTFLQAFFVVIFRQARAPAFPPPAPGTLRVAMVVTKAPSEPFSVVRETLEAMLAQTYPHDTWLADEDPQPETVAWCEAHGVRISTRKGREDYHRKEWPRRTRCKEGNLAFFYDHYGYENYDVVSQLDADHVPEPTYLEEVMRGFADPAVGYVSAPSICDRNAETSWAARTRLFTEAGFHGIFQAGYARAFTPMCIGSHYAVRTKALREVGGLGPELAEDHSTTMLLAAGGWKGVHAIDAIARGDGPATIPDLCTQEFQWSRSLVTLLLRYTPDYLGAMPWRLRFLFLFCQLLYPLFAGFMALMYLLPVLAVIFDIRYANVTYPIFLAHSVPPILAITAIAIAIRADGWFRPRDGRIFSWEKALFLALQWPWAFWGSLMAVRDRVAGGFVDFRVTPKGEAAQGRLPWRVILPYAGLALGCILPVLLVDDVREARGFYLLTLFNGIVYSAIVGIVVIGHFRATGLGWKGLEPGEAAKLAMPVALGLLLALSLQTRGMDSLRALSYGLEPVGLVRVQYPVAGAGLGAPGDTRLVFEPTWFGRETE